jgi:hypothetical protein
LKLKKHIKNNDVAIEILKSFYVKEKDLWKLRIRWWNIGVCHEPWNMNIIENIQIPGPEMKNWKRYEYAPVKPKGQD